MTSRGAPRARSCSSSRAEAPGDSPLDLARRWFSQEYLPVAQAVHERGLLRHYPGEYTADIVARLGAFRRHLARRQRKLLPWSGVIDEFAQRKVPRDKKDAIGHAISGRRARGRGHPSPGEAPSASAISEEPPRSN